MEKNKEVEPSGRKKHIKIQCQRLEKITLAGRIKWTRNAQRKVVREPTKKFTHTIIVNVNDIKDRESLVYVIRKHFGHGFFNVLVWDRYKKNKKFDRNFECIKERCKFFGNREKPCKLWGRHEIGWSCYLNPKVRPNWSVVARIKIQEVEFPIDEQKDYEYKWYRKKDKMRRFSKWFWKN